MFQYISILKLFITYMYLAQSKFTIAAVLKVISTILLFTNIDIKGELQRLYNLIQLHLH